MNLSRQPPHYRIKTYEESTVPIIQRFEVEGALFQKSLDMFASISNTHTGKIRKIDASPGVDEVTQAIRPLFKALDDEMRRTTERQQALVDAAVQGNSKAVGELLAAKADAAYQVRLKVLRAMFEQSANPQCEPA